MRVMRPSTALIVVAFTSTSKRGTRSKLDVFSASMQ